MTLLMTVCADCGVSYFPARLRCLNCENEFGIQTELQPCPQCGGFNVKVLSGEEFWVDSLSVEKEEENNS